jgi:cold shock CspA family protein
MTQGKRSRQKGSAPKQRERGHVEQWTDAVGLGRIRTDGGELLVAQFSVLVLAMATHLRNGQRVEFTRVPASQTDDSRPEARDVMLLDRLNKPAMKLTDN